MSNPTETLAELREASDVLLQQTTAAEQRLGPVDAQDSSGQVRVRLDAKGRLEAVQVGFTWDQTLGVDALPAAVLEALTQAKVARLEQYGASMTQIADEPAPRARPAATDTAFMRSVNDQMAARPDDPEVAAELLTELLHDADVALEEANRLLDEHAGRTFAGRSSSGHVTATASGNGEIVGIDIDQAWVRGGAHPANVGREIGQAVMAAGERAQREGITAALQASRLAELARRLTDQAADSD